MASKLLAIADSRRKEVEGLKKTFLSNSQSAKTHYTELYDITEEKFGNPGNLFVAVLSHLLKGDSNQKLFAAAEFKRASPSKGIIAESDDPNFASSQAIKYARGGANMVSVLTENKHFQGSLDDMMSVKQGLHDEGKSDVLVLRKDFIVDEIQIYETRAFGGDTLLLIVAILTKSELESFLAKSREVGLEPLVEVANEDELFIALEVGAKVIGVNNRNLHDFKVDLNTSLRIAALTKAEGKLLDMTQIESMPESTKNDLIRKLEGFNSVCDYSDLDVLANKVVILSLSGIKSRKDVVKYELTGDIGGVLIGETLMKASDPQKMLRELLTDGNFQSSTSTKSRVKICGLKLPSDARKAAEFGASFVGIIFAEKSKRCVTISEAKEIVKEIRSFRENEQYPILSTNAIKATWEEVSTNLERFAPLVVGVFQNQSPEEINKIVVEAGIDIVQLHDAEVNPEKEAKIKAPVVRVIHMKSDTSFTDIQLKKGPACAFLLDTAIGNVYGGTGKTFDWSLVPSFKKAFKCSNADTTDSEPVVFLAGGLNPSNVSTAILEGSPFGVDVASGVEKLDCPGEKDIEKMKQFIKNAA